MPQVGDPRAARDDHDEHALHPAAHLVRGHRLQHRRPVDRADQVTRTGHGEEHHGRTTASASARTAQPRSPRRRSRRSLRRPAASPGAASRRAAPRRPSRSGSPRRAGPARAAARRIAERPLRHLREDHARHAEAHRHDVDRGTTPAAPCAARGSGTRRRSRGSPARCRRPRAARRHRGQPPGRPERGEQRDGVEQVERREADDRDQHPGQQRARDGAGLHDRHVQRVGRRELLGGQEPRDHRAAGRLVHREERRLDRDRHSTSQTPPTPVAAVDPEDQRAWPRSRHR